MPFNNLDGLQDGVFFSLGYQALERGNPVQGLVLVIWGEVPDLHDLDLVELLDPLEVIADGLDAGPLALEDLGQVFRADVLGVAEVRELLGVMEEVHEDAFEPTG